MHVCSIYTSTTLQEKFMSCLSVYPPQICAARLSLPACHKRGAMSLLRLGTAWAVLATCRTWPSWSYMLAENSPC